MIKQRSVKALLAFGLLAKLSCLANGQVYVSDAAVTVSATTTTITSTTLVATATDESALLVEESGVAYATNVVFYKTGNTTAGDESSSYDLNAAIAIQEYGAVYLTDCNITTDGESANALHTYADGSDAYVYSTYVHAEGDGSHGLYVAGGYLYGEDVEVYTYGESGSAIATDTGGGTIVINTATAYTAGLKSALVYSTGNITVSSLTGTSEVAPAGVIDGANSFTLTSPSITAGPKEHGVFQISSTGSDNTDEAYVYVTDGSVSETRGEYGLIFIGNIVCHFYLTGTTVSIDSGIVANVSADSSWGTSGSNGGTGYIYLSDVTAEGDVYVDDISTLTLTLEDDTALTGAINEDDTASNVTLILDSSSTWTVTGTSYITVLDDADTTYSNIVSDGYYVYYDADSNSSLDNETISLSGGGYLTPA